MLGVLPHPPFLYLHGGGPELQNFSHNVRGCPIIISVRIGHYVKIRDPVRTSSISCFENKQYKMELKGSLWFSMVH
jgi:hypothetical protein